MEDTKTKVEDDGGGGLPEHGHLLVKKTFLKPTYCHFCSDLLWGLNKQGLRCKVCRFVCHSKCSKKLPAEQSCPRLFLASSARGEGHVWFKYKMAKKGFCNVCRSGISSGTEVNICRNCTRISHVACSQKILHPCRDCATCKSVPSNENNQPLPSPNTAEKQEHGQGQEEAQQHTSHCWVEGNLPSKSPCVVCNKQTKSKKSLFGFRCLWCHCFVHPACYGSAPPVCSLGPLSSLIVPPSAVAYKAPPASLSDQLAQHCLLQKAESTQKLSSVAKTKGQRALSRQPSTLSEAGSVADFDAATINPEDAVLLAICFGPTVEDLSDLFHIRTVDVLTQRVVVHKFAQAEEIITKALQAFGDSNDPSSCNLELITLESEPPGDGAVQNIIENRHYGQIVGREFVSPIDRAGHLSNLLKETDGVEGFLFVRSSTLRVSGESMKFTARLTSMITPEDEKHQRTHQQQMLEHVDLGKKGKAKRKEKAKSANAEAIPAISPLSSPRGSVHGSSAFKTIRITADSTIDRIVSKALLTFGLSHKQEDAQLEYVEVVGACRRRAVITEDHQIIDLVSRFYKYGSSLEDMKLMLTEKSSASNIPVPLFIIHKDKSLPVDELVHRLQRNLSPDVSAALRVEGIVHSPEGALLTCASEDHASIVTSSVAAIAPLAKVKWLPYVRHLPAKGFNPLLVLINTSSGGRQGHKILRECVRFFNTHQVFDITEAGPILGLCAFRRLPRFRVLVCGGDGTVNWVLTVIEKCVKAGIISDRSKIQVGVLPLGTGNDLARTLRWGGGYTESMKMAKILKRVERADCVRFDRWEVHMEEKNSTNDVVSKEYNVMTNYFGIGIDAAIALDFHLMRQSAPEKFTSRTVNKTRYFLSGIEALMKQPCRNLQDIVSITADGQLLDLKDLRGIIIMNIRHWGGGARPWGASKEDKFQRPTYFDGLLEVVGVYGVTHLSQISTKIRHGKRLAQCRELVINTRGEVPMHVDGEPRMLAGTNEITIEKHPMMAIMLRNKRKRRRKHSSREKAFSKRSLRDREGLLSSLSSQDHDTDISMRQRNGEDDDDDDDGVDGDGSDDDSESSDDAVSAVLKSGKTAAEIGKERRHLRLSSQRGSNLAKLHALKNVVESPQSSPRQARRKVSTRGSKRGKHGQRTSLNKAGTITSLFSDIMSFGDQGDAEAFLRSLDENSNSRSIDEFSSSPLSSPLKMSTGKRANMRSVPNSMSNADSIEFGFGNSVSLSKSVERPFDESLAHETIPNPNASAYDNADYADGETEIESADGLSLSQSQEVKRGQWISSHRASRKGAKEGSRAEASMPADDGSDCGENTVPSAPVAATSSHPYSFTKALSELKIEFGSRTMEEGEDEGDDEDHAYDYADDIGDDGNEEQGDPTAATTTSLKVAKMLSCTTEGHDANTTESQDGHDDRGTVVDDDPTPVPSATGSRVSLLREVDRVQEALSARDEDGGGEEDESSTDAGDVPPSSLQVASTDDDFDDSDTDYGILSDSDDDDDDFGEDDDDDDDFDEEGDEAALVSLDE